MAHHINAAIVQAFISIESAARFGLKVISLVASLMFTSASLNRRDGIATMPGRPAVTIRNRHRQLHPRVARPTDVDAPLGLEL
jgi:hypothetical protein